MRMTRAEMLDDYNISLLKDLFHNLLPTTGSAEKYGRGIILGSVVTFMALGDTFEDAIKKVIKHFPKGYRKECIPPSWEDMF